MISRLFILFCFNGLWIYPQPIFAQDFDCDLKVPPFQAGDIAVNHVITENVGYHSSNITHLICWDLAYPTNAPWIWFGVSPDQTGTLWYPFDYKLYFSNPISYIEFTLTDGATPWPEIDYGAENFVFETPSCGLSINDIYSCHSAIEGDTIYLGLGNGGHGWFSVTFDEPVMEFTISGKGGGNGSAFQICSNSIQVAPLWANICASTANCTQEAVTFTAYGTAPPYSFTYLLNGAEFTVHTTGANETVQVSVPMANGTYEYELISITDGNGETANISCNNRHTVVVNNEPEVVIPNVFTPNNDGVNDWFGITSNVEAEANLVILNRWGNVVYEKRFVTIAGDFMELWDGTSIGSVATSTGSVATPSSVSTPGSVPVSDGVYFYKVVLSGEGWEEEFVGNVTLRR